MNWDNRTYKPGRPKKYHFDKFSIGDEQFFPLDGRTIHRLQDTLIKVANRNGRFSSRRVVSGGVLGVKVKRIG